MVDRRLIVLTGPEEDTHLRAMLLVEALDPERVLWVGPGGAPPGRVRRMLGETRDAVVLGMPEGVSADLIARCAGFVRGGGALILRLPADPVPAATLAVEPFQRADVTTRLHTRLLRRFPPAPDPRPVSPPSHTLTGSDAQLTVISALVARLRRTEAGLISLTADRGRGKSSALGMAIGRLDCPVLVSAAQPAAAAEVFRFATGSPQAPTAGRIRYCPPAALLGGVSAPVICIDEAAQLSVPLLQGIVSANPTAHIVFATTIRGYEGTGRGFVLRFLAGLRDQDRPLHTLTLDTPIRWHPADPLEGRIFAALCMDAEPAEGVGAGAIHHAVLDRDRLAEDPQLLGDFFGLLVHAHYRTTPEDLHRILDAPNLTLHALLQAGRVVAASVVAAEGGLSEARCGQLSRGEGRIRGHALPDTLISHAAQTAAGTLVMIRSVRIATHPALRRQGLASQLAEAIHAHHAPDLFGTLFGATPALLRFRRSLGYRLVRIGAARGSRTGEPTAVMIRPVSAAASVLVDRLRADLARDLPALRCLMEAEGPLSPALAAAFAADLPPATPADPTHQAARIRGYLRGPCHLEAAIGPLQAAVVGADLSGLSAVERRLVVGKVMRLSSWGAVAAEAGLGVPAVQRGLKRALRRLLE